LRVGSGPVKWQGKLRVTLLAIKEVGEIFNGMLGRLLHLGLVLGSRKKELLGMDFGFVKIGMTDLQKEEKLGTKESRENNGCLYYDGAA
jgi:hypothetical protein